MIWIATTIAFAMDIIIPDLNRVPHFVVYIGKLIGILERLARKISNDDKGLIILGIILWILVVGSSWLITFFALKFLKLYFIYGYYIFFTILLFQCLCTRTLAREKTRICNAMEKSIDDGRKALSMIVGRDTSRLSKREIIKATIETLAENTSDGIVAPLFYFAIGGLPLCVAYKAVNTLDSMIGYKDDRFLYLGRASARLDDLFNFIPARLTAIFMIIATIMVKVFYIIVGKEGMVYRLSGKRGVYIIQRDATKHLSPNSGYPESAVAGALGIRLGGNAYYFGKLYEKAALGDEIEAIEEKHLYLTQKIMIVSSIIAMIFTMSICILRTLLT